MADGLHQKIIMQQRPVGAPKDSDFALIDGAVPEPDDGQVLVRTIFLSLDPYMRGRMSAGRSYVKPMDEGDTMVGGTVGEVVKSRLADFAEGDIVQGYGGWQTHAVSNGRDLRKIDPGLAPISTSVGVLGMPGFTAYVGLLDHGRPAEGETVVVSAASGAVGGVVGQLAKLKGARVVGIAGAQEKCDYVVNELGFDLCVSHRSDKLKDELAAACPKGIDVYYENVGGPVLEAVIPLFNHFARMPVCGLISQYNATELPAGPNKLPMLMRAILTNKLSIRGFIQNDHLDRFPDFMRDMPAWIQSGQVKYREDIVDGLENAVRAFQGLLEGRNFGKLLVRVGADPST